MPTAHSGRRFDKDGMQVPGAAVFSNSDKTSTLELVSIPRHNSLAPRNHRTKRALEQIAADDDLRLSQLCHVFAHHSRRMTNDCSEQTQLPIPPAALREGRYVEYSYLGLKRYRVPNLCRLTTPPRSNFTHPISGGPVSSCQHVSLSALLFQPFFSAPCRQFS